MADGLIADDTELRVRLVSDAHVNAMADLWSAFDADNAQWRLDHPGQADPPHCAVAIPASPTNAEKAFVEVRMKVENDLDTTVANEISEWRQINSTNYPTVTGVLAELKKIFDTERTRLTLDPPV